MTDGQSATTSSDTEIVFSSATVGAVIYYTIDGTTPDPRSPNTRKYAPGSPLKLAVGNPSVDLSNASVTARATAIGPNMKPSLISTVTVNVQYPRAAAPTFSLPSAVYNEDQKVELSTVTQGADIYYTMVAPGNSAAPRPVPGQQGTHLYSGPISVNGPNNVWIISAIAVKDQLIASPTASATYSVTYDGCAAPFFTPGGGTYDNDIYLILHGDENSTIYYTTDGSDPIIGSSPYTAPNTEIALSGNLHINEGRIVMKALAAETGKNPSSITTAEYIFQAARVRPSMQAGTYDNAINLSLSTDTQEAVIYYTTDGTTPYPGGYLYQSPLAISSSQTVRAVAVRDGYLRSSEWMGTYTMTTATPTFNRAGGDYFDDLTITISCATLNSTMYITQDGSNPADPGNSSRQKYSASNIIFTVPCPAALTLRACATRAGFNDSAINTVVYNLWEMPIEKELNLSSNILPPTLPTPGTTENPNYWLAPHPVGWEYGAYTYVVWDQDYYNSTSCMITVYETANMGSIAREWPCQGNRYIDTIDINRANGTIVLNGQYGASVLYWPDFRPPFH